MSPEISKSSGGETLGTVRGVQNLSVVWFFKAILYFIDVLFIEILSCLCYFKTKTDSKINCNL